MIDELTLILLGMLMATSPSIASDTANNDTVVVVSPTTCNICRDGAAITLPDKQVPQIPGFESIDNCQALVTLVSAFLPAESEECGLLQSLGTMCGCPKDPNSCELCQGHGPARYTQRKLEFLAPTFNGIVPTCEMIEAGLHSYQNDDTYCTGSQSFFAEYCGCGATDDVPPSIPDDERCRICGVYFNDEEYVIRNKTIKIENFPFETCGLLADAARTLFKEFTNSNDPLVYTSSNCFLISVLSMHCGCPNISFIAPEDQCKICKANDTHLTPFPDNLVENDALSEQFLGGLKPTCEVMGDIGRFFTDKLDNYGAHGALCSLIQSVGETSCGCTPVAKPLCPICTEPIPDALQNKAFIKTPPFDSLTCEQATAGARNLDGGELLFYDETSGTWIEFECSVWQYAGFLCGCNKDIFTYWGAETESQQIAAVWLQRVSAMLSFIGSIAIMVDVIRKQRWGTLKSQIMLGLSFFDLMSSIGWGLGPTATDKGFIELYTGLDPSVLVGEDPRFYGSIGNEASCLAQGFILHWGFTSMLFNMCLTYFYKLSIINRMRDNQFGTRLRLALLGIPVLIGTTVALLSIQFIVATPVGCTFGSFSTEGGWAKVVGLFYLPYGPAFVYIPFTTWNIYFSVRAQTGSTNRNASQQNSSTSGPASAEGSSEATSTNISQTRLSKLRGFLTAASTRNELSIESKVFWEAFWYVVAFFASYSIFLVVFALDGLKTEAYGMLVLASILTPLQGFFNSINYFRHGLTKMWQTLLKNLANTRQHLFRILPSIANRNSIPSALLAVQGDHGLSDLPSISQVQSSGFVWSRPFASGRARPLDSVIGASKAIEEEKEEIEGMPSSMGHKSSCQTIVSSSGTATGSQPTSAILDISTLSIPGLESGQSGCQTVLSSSGMAGAQPTSSIPEVLSLNVSGLQSELSLISS